MAGSSRPKGQRILVAVAFLFVLCGTVTFFQRPAQVASAPVPKTQESLSGELPKAMARGNLDEVQAMLAAGADPNWIDPRGKTAVHRAAFAGTLTLLEIVLAHGGDPNVRDLSGSTPLQDAFLARAHALEKIEMLLAAGADPNAADRNGGTPLHTAARTNNGRAILTLLEAGASPLAETGGATFQTFYFGYSTAILNDRALAERQEVIAWLEQNGIPLEANVRAPID